MDKTRLSVRGACDARLRRTIVATTVVAFVTGLSGCGAIPDAQVAYYHAKTQVAVKVTRSVLCDAKNLPIVANTTVPSTVHSADPVKPQSLSLAGLRGPFTDSDIKFEFYEDGRLKSINASQTGQGESILKAVTTLATTLGGFTVGAAAPAFPEECKFVKEAGGGKPLTLTYEGVVDLSKTDPQEILPDGASAAYAELLKSAISRVCVVTKGVDVPEQPVQYKRNEGDVLVAARQPALLKIDVGAPAPGNLCPPTLWQGRVPVAQLGKDYVLPVPRAAAFGKQTFGAAFAESGALTSVQYVNSSGTAGAVGAVNSLATIVQGETTSAKVAELKAQADLIAQQQRLIQCLADPKSCK